jgi:hypothetical protein
MLVNGAEPVAVVGGLIVSWDSQYATQTTPDAYGGQFTVPRPVAGGGADETLTPATVTVTAVAPGESEPFVFAEVAAAATGPVERETLTFAQSDATATGPGEREALVHAEVGSAAIGPAESEPLVYAAVPVELVAPTEETEGEGTTETLVFAEVPVQAFGVGESESLTFAALTVEAVAPTEATAPEPEPEPEPEPVPSGPTGGADLGDESSIYPERYATRETLPPVTVRVEAVAPTETTEPPRIRVLAPSRRPATQEGLAAIQVRVLPVAPLEREALPSASVSVAASNAEPYVTLTVEEMAALRADRVRLRDTETRAAQKRRELEADDELAVLALLSAL